MAAASQRAWKTAALASSRGLQVVKDATKTAVDRLRAMHAQGRTLQAIATQLKAEGVPTLTGRGVWQKGTISNLLKAEAPEG